MLKPNHLRIIKSLNYFIHLIFLLICFLQFWSSELYRIIFFPQVYFPQKTKIWPKNLELLKLYKLKALNVYSQVFYLPIELDNRPTRYCQIVQAKSHQQLKIAIFYILKFRPQDLVSNPCTFVSALQFLLSILFFRMKSHSKVQ